MQRISITLRGQRTWLLAALLVTSLSLLLVLPAQPVQAEPQPVALKNGLKQSQIYNDDLEVERGQILEGDIVVYSGDVKVKSEGRIAGTLTVYSGDIDVEEGGRVDGNVTSWSGDIDVNGRVDGSISAMSGSVEIGDTAQIGGNITVMSGDIKQRAGASVGGNVLHGSEFNLPAAPDVNLLPWLPAQDAPLTPNAAQEMERNGRWEGPLGFVGRGLAALLLLGLFVGGAAAVAALRPGWSGEMHAVLNRQPALAFAAGLIANVLLLAVIGFLYFTVCLRPPALLLGLGLLALNVGGMAAAGAEIGGRASERMSGRWTPTARVALGVLLPGVFIVFLWMLGGCFAFFASLGTLLIGSFGVGSILVNALNLGAGTARTTSDPLSPTPAEPQSAPVGQTPAAPAPVAPAAPAADSSPSDTVAVDPEPVAPEPVEPAAWWQESIAATEAPVDAQTERQAESQAESQAEAQNETATPPVAARSSGEMLPMVQDDFSLIEGIGPKLSQRLHAANIRTFVDLASLPPETLAGILGWTSERVLRSGVLDRARRLATE